jgi:hypothetical protein
MWARAFGGAGDLANAVVLMPDSGFAIAGWTGHYGLADGDQSSHDAIVVHIDKLGQLQWARTFGDTLSEVFEDIILTQDGGLAMTGYITSPPTQGSNPRHAYVVKCDASGTGQWSLRAMLNGVSHAYALAQGPNGELSITGWASTAMLTLPQYAFLLGLEADGSTCPDCNVTPYGSNGQAFLNVDTLSPTVTDLPVIVDNRTITEIYGGTQIALCIGLNIQAPHNAISELHIAPNPFNDRTVVALPKGFAGDGVSIEVMDAQGRGILRSTVVSERFVLERGSLADGAYLVRVTGAAGRGARISRLLVVGEK